MIVKIGNGTNPEKGCCGCLGTLTAHIKKEHLDKTLNAFVQQITEQIKRRII